jgi:hypothetical protein
MIEFIIFLLTINDCVGTSLEFYFVYVETWPYLTAFIVYVGLLDI